MGNHPSPTFPWVFIYSMGQINQNQDNPADVWHGNTRTRADPEKRVWFSSGWARRIAFWDSQEDTHTKTELKQRMDVIHGLMISHSLCGSDRARFTCIHKEWQQTVWCWEDLINNICDESMTTETKLALGQRTHTHTHTSEASEQTGFLLCNAFWELAERQWRHLMLETFPLNTHAKHIYAFENIHI